MTWWVEIEPEEAGEGEPRLGLLEVGVEVGSVCPWCGEGRRRVRGRGDASGAGYSDSEEADGAGAAAPPV